MHIYISILFILIQEIVMLILKKRFSRSSTYLPIEIAALLNILANSAVVR